MNNILNIKRFGLVLRKDLMENGKRYALLFLTMLGIIAVINIWLSFENYDSSLTDLSHNNLNSKLLTASSLMFVGFGLLFSSTAMNPMNSKIKRITYLSYPASNIEKYLTRWIIITVGFIISFFIALCIAEILRVGICSAYYLELDIKFIDITMLVGSGPGYASDKEPFTIGVCFYFLSQSLFVLGSTFWEKGTFVKTFTAVSLINVFYFLVCYWAILIFYGNIEIFFNALSSFNSFNDENDINGDQAITIVASVISIIAVINWTLAYFRFRESEIIKRL